MKAGDPSAIRHQVPGELVRAAVRAVDAAADALPALLSLSDGRMNGLQLAIEQAFARALTPPVHPGRPRGRR